MKKILLLCPSTYNVVNFRRGLIQSLQSAGYSVDVCAFDDKQLKQVEELNVGFHLLADDNRSLKCTSLLSLKSKYVNVIKSVNPDIVFTFVVKPNTFGVLAAHKAGVKEIYSMVEGAGDVFINKSLKWRLIKKIVCALYKRAFRFSKKVFFLNDDDREEFVSLKLVKPEQCETVHGIGVDLDRFAYSEQTNDATFLMVARMIKTKGVFDYLDAAKIVKEKYPQAVFNYVGAEAAITKSDIEPYVKSGVIDYKGKTIDTVPFYKDASVIVLPSSREGLPLAIVESGAIGRMSIGYNSIGIKDTIIDNETGFLVEQKDVNALAEKMIWCIENPDKVREMGKKAHEYVTAHFDRKKINAYIVSVING